jgi:hypothetical protein
MAPDVLHRSVREGGACRATLQHIPIATNERWDGVTGISCQLLDQVPSASNTPEKRDDAVTNGQGAVDIECRDMGPIAAHCPRAGIASSASQKAGQLLDTTPGSLTSMPSTTSPRMPKAMPSR